MLYDNDKKTRQYFHAIKSGTGKKKYKQTGNQSIIQEDKKKVER